MVEDKLLMAEKRLEEIAKKIKKCKICRQNKVGLPVPGEGNVRAKIVFIGEAPGKEEAKTGRPFVGRAGKLLRSLIVEAGLKETEVFITSPVKYFPEHVTPTLEEINHGRVHLQDQLDIIMPAIVVLLGRVAALAVLKKNVEIAKDHGKIFEENGIKYFISYHPAAPLHSPKTKIELIKDFKKLKKLISYGK